MLRAVLAQGKSGRVLASSQIWRFSDTLDDRSEVLITESSFRESGRWTTAQIVSATTTTLVTPLSEGSLVITDVVVSAKKVNNTTLDLEFDDGVNTEVLVSPDTINEPVNFSWSPQGRIQGWRDASMKVVTGGAGTPAVTVTIGYIKVPVGLPFAEWDALR